VNGCTTGTDGVRPGGGTSSVKRLEENLNIDEYNDCFTFFNLFDRSIVRDQK
jgi:hypothetical protein